MIEFDFLKIETFIPEEYVHKLRMSLNNINALTVGGNYDNCMVVSKVTSFWRPLKGAHPFNGTIDKLCEMEELKVEFCCNNTLLEDVISTIKNVHPYEVPVINIIPVINPFKI
nr:divalent cation tolerance protein CutA [Clostridium senegalense]